MEPKMEKRSSAEPTWNPRWFLLPTVSAKQTIACCYRALEIQEAAKGFAEIIDLKA